MSLDINTTFSGFETLAKAESAEVEGAEITGSFSEATLVLTGDAARVCESFANHPNEPAAIARFTKRYGPLAIPRGTNAEFRFGVDDWVKQQAELRDNWRELAALSNLGSRRVACLQTNVPRPIQIVFPGKGFRLRLATVLDLMYVHLLSIPREYIRVCPAANCGKCFVALHLKQTYCGRPACVAWGKKKLKLEYWNRNKKELLAKRKKKREND